MEINLLERNSENLKLRKFGMNRTKIKRENSEMKGEIFSGVYLKKYVCYTEVF